jgi:hypothetical protein
MTDIRRAGLIMIETPVLQTKHPITYLAQFNEIGLIVPMSADQCLKFGRATGPNCSIGPVRLEWTSISACTAVANDLRYDFRRQS